MKFNVADGNMARQATEMIVISNEQRNKLIKFFFSLKLRISLYPAIVKVLITMSSISGKLTSKTEVTDILSICAIQTST